MYDVAVVGAGPAGSSTALRLARSGLRVVVLERAQFPRVKVCGEYLSGAAMLALEECGVWSDLADRAQRVDGFRLFGAGTSADLALPAPARSVPRAILDDAIFNAAVKAGALAVRGAAMSCVATEDGVEIDFRDDSGVSHTLAARMVVGADGIGSAVARSFGLERASGRRRFAIGGHYRGFTLDGFVEMYVDRKRYFALNPLGPDLANVMVVVPEEEVALWREDFDTRVREAAESLSGGARRLDTATLEGKRVATGPLDFQVRSCTAIHALLVGDAAGFVDPFIGQGVSLALQGARDAARVIVAVIRGEEAEDVAWERYRRATEARLRERRGLARMIALIVRNRPLARRAAHVLAREPRRARQLIQAVAGDASPSYFELARVLV